MTVGFGVGEMFYKFYVLQTLSLLVGLCLWTVTFINVLIFFFSLEVRQEGQKEMEWDKCPSPGWVGPSKVVFLRK